MTAAKQMLVRHIAERHRRLHKELPRRVTFAELSRLHGRDHHRYSGALDHWHGPQPDRGPGSRPDGWTTGTHVHEKEPR